MAKKKDGFTKTQKQHLQNLVIHNRFDDLLTSGEFEDIKDPEFHRLRIAYLEARGELIDYCGLYYV